MTSRAEIRRLLSELQEEHREAVDQLKRLSQRVDGLASGIAGLRALLRTFDGEEAEGDDGGVKSPRVEEIPTPSAADDYPRGAEAVRAVLMDSDGGLTVREITAALLARGWTPRSKNPENATSSNAFRAAEVYPDVVRRRVANGSMVYEYVPQDENGVTPVSDGISKLEAPLPHAERSGITPLRGTWRPSTTLVGEVPQPEGAPEGTTEVVMN